MLFLQWMKFIPWWKKIFGDQMLPCPPSLPLWHCHLKRLVKQGSLVIWNIILNIWMCCVHWDNQSFSLMTYDAPDSPIHRKDHLTKIRFGKIRPRCWPKWPGIFFPTVPAIKKLPAILSHGPYKNNVLQAGTSVTASEYPKCLYIVFAASYLQTFNSTCKVDNIPRED